MCRAAGGLASERGVTLVSTDRVIETETLTYAETVLYNPEYGQFQIRGYFKILPYVTLRHRSGARFENCNPAFTR
jgi:hypothetical protein